MRPKVPSRRGRVVQSPAAGRPEEGATRSPAGEEEVGGSPPPSRLELLQSLQMHWNPPGRFLRSPAVWLGDADVSELPRPLPSAAARPPPQPLDTLGGWRGGRARARLLSEEDGVRNATRRAPTGRSGYRIPRHLRRGTCTPSAAGPRRAYPPGKASTTCLRTVG